jgi:hypothetical protein
MTAIGVMIGNPLKFIAAWVLFCFAAASMAKGKNRNVWLWIVLGLLFGPFALLAIGMLKPGPGPDQGYQ